MSLSTQFQPGDEEGQAGTHREEMADPVEGTTGDGINKTEDKRSPETQKR